MNKKNSPAPQSIMRADPVNLTRNAHSGVAAHPERGYLRWIHGKQGGAIITPEPTRTADLLLRRQLLYPT